MLPAGPWTKGIPGISRKNLPGEKRNYGDCVMRDPKTYGRNGLVESCPDWAAVDGGAWWLTDHESFGDPNGDYCTDGLLEFVRYVRCGAASLCGCLCGGGVWEFEDSGTWVVGAP